MKCIFENGKQLLNAYILIFEGLRVGLELLKQHKMFERMVEKK